MLDSDSDFDIHIYREAVSRLRVSPETRKQIINRQYHEKSKQRFSAFAVGVVAALVFIMTMAAFTVFHPGIQEWFFRNWPTFTGQEMHENQLMLIDSLTQKIDQSVTQGDITVTVDSVTSGGSVVWALLKISGIDFRDDANYTFWNTNVSITPQPAVSHSFGIEGQHMLQNGAVIIPLHYNADMSDSHIPRFTDGGYTLNISLTDLYVNPNPRCGGEFGFFGRFESEGKASPYELLQNGTWNFSIPLAKNSASPVIEIDRMTFGDCILTDVCLTATDLTYTANQNIALDGMVLSDGSVVNYSGWFSVIGYSRMVYFPVPLNTENIVALRFSFASGETVEVPLPVRD